MQLSSYVLAGGESSRMGRDKSLLRLGGITLLEIALRKLQHLCGNAAILCGSPQHGDALKAYGRVVADRVAGCGPLSGLDAALDDTVSDWLLIVPVDIPLFPVEAFRMLADHAMKDGKPKVCCFQSPQLLQPMPVVLHRSARKVVKQSLDGGSHKLMPVLRRAAETMQPSGLSIVPSSDFVEDAIADRWFTNVNTPDDLQNAEEIAHLQNASVLRASD